MLAKELEKGAMYLVDKLGFSFKAQLLESPRQGRGYKDTVLMRVLFGRKTYLIDVNDIISRVYIAGSVSGGYRFKTQNKKGEYINVS